MSIKKYAITVTSHVSKSRTKVVETKEVYEVEHLGRCMQYH